MVLHTYVTPSNNEYKERIKETRYMSYSETLTDDIKRLMDIDIVRDLANKAMYLNDQLPYDVASITARQIYLGEPISGIEIPLIEEEDEEIEINNDGLLIENPHYKEENINLSPENIYADHVIEELNKVEDEKIIDLPIAEEVISESVQNDIIIDSPIEEEIISESNINDIITEPAKENILDDSIIEEVISEPIQSDIIVDLPVTEEIINEPVQNNIIIDSPIEEEIISESNINDIITESLKEDVLDDSIIEEEIISEPIPNNEIIESNISNDNLIVDENDELEKTFDLSNMLSELPVGMLDEIPNKNMLDELPLGDEIKEEELIINDDLLDSLQKENTSDLLDIITNDIEEIKHDDLLANINEEETKLEDLLPNLSETLNNETLEELPDIADNILLDEPIKPFEQTQEISTLDLPNLDDTSKMLASLTNGFTMDFQDEPVMQKVKTR